MIDFWFPWYFWTIFVKISFWQNLTFGWIQFALGNDWVKSDYRFRNKKSKKKKKVEIIFCSKKNFCSCHKQATRKKLWMFQTFQMFQISPKEEKNMSKGNRWVAPRFCWSYFEINSIKKCNFCKYFTDQYFYWSLTCLIYLFYCLTLNAGNHNIYQSWLAIEFVSMWTAKKEKNEMKWNEMKGFLKLYILLVIE